MTRRTAVCCLLGIILVSGCQYDPYTHWYAPREPERDQIVGAWIATQDSLRDLRLTPGLIPAVEVRPDGSILLMAVPIGWRGGSLEVGTTVEDFSGRWSLEREQEAWWGLTIQKDDWACYGCLMVMYDKAPHRLVLRYGDPDEGLGLEFERGRRTRR